MHRQKKRKISQKLHVKNLILEKIDDVTKE